VAAEYAKYLEGYAGIIEDASATGRRLTREELDSRRALGEQAAEAGLGLRALVGAHMAATRSNWSPGDDRSVDDMLAAAAQAPDAFAEGYERAQRLAVRQEEAARREFVDEGYERAQRLAVRQEEAARREFVDDLLYGRSDQVPVRPAVHQQPAHRRALERLRPATRAGSVTPEPKW
jgi:hypothetical protein